MSDSTEREMEPGGGTVDSSEDIHCGDQYLVSREGVGVRGGFWWGLV